MSFTFSFLDKVDPSVYSFKTRKKTSNESPVNANTVTGNFSLGMFKIENENYEMVDQSLKELLVLIKGLNSIIIDQKSYKINWYLGGDLKFLALVLGINAANSYHPWIFCDSHKNTVHSGHERKFDSNNICHLGYKYEPIIDFIKPENIIVDILHLFLRVSDKLIVMLIDDINKSEPSYDKDLTYTLKKYFDFLTDFILIFWLFDKKDLIDSTKKHKIMSLVTLMA